MTTQEWARMAARIAAWWPATKWTAEMFTVWYEDLRAFDAEDVRSALDECKMLPGAFAPSIGDVLNHVRADRSTPTFDEALHLIFGPDGVMAARPAAAPKVDHAALLAAWEDGADWPDAPVGAGITRDGEYRSRRQEAREQRAAQVHPLVASFIVRLGYDRLDRDGGVLDGNPRDGRGEDTAHWVRKELREAWDAHLEAMEGREVAVLAAGTGREGLRRVDPLAALNAPAHLRVLEPGEAA